MTTTLRTILLALLAACTSTADPGAERLLGTTCPGGTVNGTIGHHPFAPVGAACVLTGTDPELGPMYMIRMRSDSDTCPVFGGPGGDELQLMFCGASAPALGTYSNDTGFDCPASNHPVINVLFGDAASEIVADAGGTVTITGHDGPCVSGTFDLPFARTALVTDHLTGEFHALEPQ